MDDIAYQEDNPLLDLLIEKQSIPEACSTPVLVYTLGMFSLVSAVFAITSWENRFVSTTTTDIWRFVLMIGWGPLLLMPLAGWLVATLLTATLTRPQVFDLVRVSGLTNRDIVRALTAASYFWTRAWITWLIGYTPLLIVALAYLNRQAGVGWPLAVLKGMWLTALCWGGLALSIKAGVAVRLRWPVWAVVPMLALVVQWALLLVMIAVLIVAPLHIQQTAASEGVLLLSLTVLMPGMIAAWHGLALRWARATRSE